MCFVVTKCFKQLNLDGGDMKTLLILALFCASFGASAEWELTQSGEYRTECRETHEYFYTRERRELPTLEECQRLHELRKIAHELNLKVNAEKNGEISF